MTRTRAKHSLAGVLTEYPVGTRVLDWAVGTGAFTQANPKRQEPQFIGGFTSGGHDHLHFEKGARC